MMIAIQCICFLITFSVIFYYIRKGIQSKAHRLLPLLLCLISAYNVLQVLQYAIDLSKVIVILENVILIQALYVLVYYILEFSYLKMPKWGDALLIFSMLFMYAMAMILYHNHELYRLCFTIYIFLYLILVLVLATYVYQNCYLNMREHHVANMLYLALVLPEIALLIHNLTKMPEDVLVPISIAGSCLIALYLMKTDQLEDTSVLLQENLFDSSDAAIVLYDEDGYFLKANQAARTLFEKEEKEVPIEQQKKENLDQAVDEEFLIGKRCYRCHVEKRKVHGRSCGYIVSFTDITKEKQEMQKMEELRQEAEKRSVFKSRFLANMSHDLRSPLHAMLGLNDILLARKDLSQRNRNYLKQMKKAGASLLSIVNDILLYSRIETGKLILLREAYSFRELMEELAQLTVVQLKQKQVQFSLNYRTECPKELVGDSLRVREMLQNILYNAVKYTQKGSITCEIFAEMEKKENKVNKVKMTCMVKDTGSGMSEEEIEEVFEEYVTHAGADKEEGIGLGLAIVKNLARLMDGEVKAFSDGKTGTTITLSFWQELSENSSVIEPSHWESKEPVSDEEEEETFFIKNWNYPEARVLLVDDMKVNQEIFAELASIWNIKPEVASSGEEALERVKRHPYDLLILDQMMPGLSGMETAELLRKEYKMPMILLTADASNETRLKAREHGMEGFLTKPIKLNELNAQFEQFLPEAFRVSCVGQNMENYQSDASLREQNRQKTYRVVVRELEELEKSLEQYAREDVELFRIKVHGVKGLMRQMGFPSMARSAEIMEMAAKAGHLLFLRENLGDFMEEYREVLEELQEKLKRMTQKETAPVKEVVSPEEERRCWEDVKKGFDDYDLNAIEKAIAQLQKIVLEDRKVSLLAKLCDAMEQIEYETGSELLEEFLTKEEQV
ncbi:response regulator [Roseburia sp. 831b]|uniref:response regulator n=1 Tax=Roseburia sp. 831b TaxID=1261635 RepID=UPI0009515F35|nr:response regulator [Roseburia sp. 831b]WVK71741.1 response regulator [Roseburia sp. 831b]